MGIKKAAFAKRVGITRQALNNLINRGKVSGVLDDGTLDENIALATYNTNVRRYANDMKAEGGGLGGDGLSSSVVISKAMILKYEALQKKAEHEKFIGELVSSEEVYRSTMTLAREVRDRFLSIPDRISSLLVGKSDKEIYRLLTAEMRQALERFSGGE